MYRFRFILIFISLFLLPSGIFAANNKNSAAISFIFIGDFTGYPYLYESVQANNSFALSGRISFGLGYRDFNFTVSMFENYLSFGDENSSFYGASNIFRWTLDVFYQPVQWFVLEGGAGAAYLASSYAYNQQSNIIQNIPGISLNLNMRFITPLKFLDFELLNSFDLFIENTRISPSYYGGLRVITHPFVQWIDLYLEAGGSPYYLTSTELTFISGLFYGGTGIRIRIDTNKIVSELISYRSAKTSTDTDQTEKADRSETTQEKIQMDAIDQLKTAKEGDIISFNNIIFYPDKDIIKQESIPVLDNIARILKEKNALIIEIRGYTNATGDPKAELELSLKRALKIAEYLNSKSISYDKLKASGFGGFKPASYKIDEQNRRVEIKILKL